MKTEIDQFLAEQNSLLMQQNALLTQQINSLQNIVNAQIEIEQILQNKINNLNSEKEILETEISNLKSNLPIQLQQLLTQALNQLNLNSIINSLVKTALTPIQQKITSQQDEMQQALLLISQLKTSENTCEEQNIKINKIEQTLENLIKLIKNLDD